MALTDEQKKNLGIATKNAIQSVYNYVDQKTQAQEQQTQADADLRAQYPVTQVYDQNTDYMKLMQQYANQGDYLKAAQAEQQRNSKITGEGMDTSLYTDMYSKYLPENRYRYDPAQNEAYTAAKAQQDAIFEKIMNRGDFRYNVEDDPLYQQYRDQYTAQGRNAMRDTMGQAAALTGGYGSTYAQQAGQQSYDAYLARLNDIVPELYGAAYNRYQDEGTALMNRYNMAAGQATDAYNQGYNAWSTRLGLEREDEANAYNRRIAAEQQAYQQTQDARSYLVTLISSTGYTPTDAELAAAGMTRDQANSLKAAYEQALAAASFSSGGGSGRSSGGSGRRSSGGSGGGNVTPQASTQKAEPTAAEVAAQRKQQITTNLEYMKRYGATKDQMVAEIERYIAEYGLDDAFAAELMRKYVNTASTAAKGSGGGKTGARGGGKTNTKGSY